MWETRYFYLNPLHCRLVKITDKHEVQVHLVPDLSPYPLGPLDPFLEPAGTVRFHPWNKYENLCGYQRIIPIYLEFFSAVVLIYKCCCSWRNQILYFHQNYCDTCEDNFLLSRQMFAYIFMLLFSFFPKYVHLVAQKQKATQVKEFVVIPLGLLVEVKLTFWVC